MQICSVDAAWERLVRDAPDRAVAVFRDEQRAVVRDRHADGTSPYLGIVDDKTDHEIFVFAGWNAVLRPDADHLVAGAPGPVPRSMLGGETIAAIFRRE